MSVSVRNTPVIEHEVVLHELHHRFYNSLQLISAMTNSLNADTLKTGVAKLQDKIALLAGLHKTLALPLQTETGLRGVCDALCMSLLRAFDRNDVGMSISVDDVRIAPEVARCILMLVVELVTNALKHGAKTGPMDIVVELRDRSFGCELHVSNTFDETGRQCAPLVAGKLAHSMGGTLQVQVNESFSVRALIPPPAPQSCGDRI